MNLFDPEIFRDTKTREFMKLIALLTHEYADNVDKQHALLTFAYAAAFCRFATEDEARDAFLHSTQECSNLIINYYIVRERNAKRPEDTTH